jgi:hypothetical protein
MGNKTSSQEFLITKPAALTTPYHSSTPTAIHTLDYLTQLTKVNMQELYDNGLTQYSYTYNNYPIAPLTWYTCTFLKPEDNFSIVDSIWGSKLYKNSEYKHTIYCTKETLQSIGTPIPKKKKQPVLKTEYIQVDTTICVINKRIYTVDNAIKYMNTNNVNFEQFIKVNNPGITQFTLQFQNKSTYECVIINPVKNDSRHRYRLKVVNDDINNIDLAERTWPELQGLTCDSRTLTTIGNT